MNMDIEGAEYIVLPNMIKKGSIYFLNQLEIAFHHHKFKHNKENQIKFRKIHRELMKNFFNKFLYKKTNHHSRVYNFSKKIK